MFQNTKIKNLYNVTSYIVGISDDIINVDTSQGAVTLYLPNIMLSGIMSSPKRFYVNDVGGYAATNNIIIIGSSGDAINGSSSYSLQVNYSSAEILFSNQTNWLVNSDQTSASGAGTVTSVGLTLPTALFSTPVIGSPITISGTFAPTLANQSANTVFAGPASGSSSTPTFRALVAADLPAGIGSVTSVALSMPAIFSVAGSPITSSGTLAVSLATQTANTVFAGPTSGGSSIPAFRALVAADLPSNTILDNFGITIDGQGGVISTGVYTQYVVPFSGTITGWQIFECSSTPVSSSIVIDTWKDTYANYPPTVANTIWGGSKPTLSSQTKNEATGLSIAVSAGDIFWFNVDSVTSAVKTQLVIFITKS